MSKPGKPSASRDAKAAGLDSVTEAARMVGMDQNSLRKWWTSRPELFRAVILGCAQMKNSLEK